MLVCYYLSKVCCQQLKLLTVKVKEVKVKEVERFQASTFTMPSFGWEHFSIFDKKQEIAKCNICGKNVSTKGKSTTGLLKHLAKVHNLRPKPDEIEPPVKKSYQSSIPFPMKEEKDTGEILAKLWAVDRVSIRTIAQSEFIQESFQKRKLKVPKNRDLDIMKLIREHTEKLRSQVMLVQERL